MTFKEALRELCKFDSWQDKWATILTAVSLPFYATFFMFKQTPLIVIAGVILFFALIFRSWDNLKRDLKKGGFDG